MISAAGADLHQASAPAPSRRRCRRPRSALAQEAPAFRRPAPSPPSRMPAAPAVAPSAALGLVTRRRSRCCCPRCSSRRRRAVCSRRSRSWLLRLLLPRRRRCRHPRRPRWWLRLPRRRLPWWLSPSHRFLHRSRRLPSGAGGSGSSTVRGGRPLRRRWLPSLHRSRRSLPLRRRSLPFLRRSPRPLRAGKRIRFPPSLRWPMRRRPIRIRVRTSACSRISLDIVSEHNLLRGADAQQLGRGDSSSRHSTWSIRPRRDAPGDPAPLPG